MEPTLHLVLNFTSPDQVVVQLNGAGHSRHSAPLSFAGPLTEADQQDLHWYLEIYPAHYATDVDDARAARIAHRLEQWGEDLFNAVFRRSDTGRELFARFDQHRQPGRLLSIDSDDPSVLAQPWELLRRPEGGWLFLDEPRINLRRRLSGSGNTPGFEVKPKDRLQLLFVVSRPKGAGFIDPRADPRAVMDALDEHAPGRVSVEFLHPPTLAGLVQRLTDDSRPAVDILHFDGHGAYDADGSLADEAITALNPDALEGVPSELLDRTVVRPGAHQGYLLFENQRGLRSLIPASLLGELLKQQSVGLVVLSACQSAMIGGDDPMGSVAARLTAAGIPAVLAMTHSVLTDTTRALFGHLYAGLGHGQRLGTALENARRELYQQPQRGERRRGQAWITLELQDWFLPALYQSGQDPALLTATTRRPTAESPAPATPTHNLTPVQRSGFWGRSRDLWAIERDFVRGVRRVVVHGFGGQGKTCLAEEAGRWLLRTGLFERACLISFVGFQGVDPVGWAVSTLATVLDESLLGEQAATEALARTPTLLILDNLESLDDRTDDGDQAAKDRDRLDELLAAAVAWSEAGAGRVLMTTRSPDLEHPGFPTETDPRCRYLGLSGLAPEDALDWFQALVKLPPEPQVELPGRDELLDLFAKVDYHPLSVSLLAHELKARRPNELGERLETLLASDGDRLRASLELSLDRLSPNARKWLPRLGVFHGGAFEDQLLDVTGLTQHLWADLRKGLEAVGLLQVERVAGIHLPYLKFHPALAATLWKRITEEERAQLIERFQKIHFELANDLVVQDERDIRIAREMAQRVMPNLLAAVHKALDSGAPFALEFVVRVSWFLLRLGLLQEHNALSRRCAATVSVIGSKDWFLAQSAQGEMLIQAGRLAEAATVFEKLLEEVELPLSDTHLETLHNLVRCCSRQRQTGRAKTLLHQALNENLALGAILPEHNTKLRDSHLQMELAYVLTDEGDFTGAETAYLAALSFFKESGDFRGVAIAEDQLGSLAYRQGKLEDALKRHLAAQNSFHHLREPVSEAIALNSLGLVYAEMGAEELAETAFRQSAHLREANGDTVGAVSAWNNIGLLMQSSDRSDIAEAWYRKALSCARDADESGHLSSGTLQNLANLLARLPGRLDEARALAEEALTLRKSLDPTAVEIWKTDELLAEITERQDNKPAASRHHVLDRGILAGASDIPDEMFDYSPLIVAVIDTVARPELRAELETTLNDGVDQGWGDLVAAIRRILNGERNADVLCAPLSHDKATVILKTLEALRDPSEINDLVEEESHVAARISKEVEKTYLSSNVELIRDVLAATQDPVKCREINQPLRGLVEQGWGALAAAIKRLLAGERAPETLCAALNTEETLIVQAILTGIADPEVLESILVPQDSEKP